MMTHLMLQCKVFPYFTFVTISYNGMGWTYEWSYGFQCGFNQGMLCKLCWPYLGVICCNKS